MNMVLKTFFAMLLVVGLAFGGVAIADNDAPAEEPVAVEENMPAEPAPEKSESDE